MDTMAASARWGMKHAARDRRAVYAPLKGHSIFNMTGSTSLCYLLSPYRQGRVGAMTCGA